LTSDALQIFPTRPNLFRGSAATEIGPRWQRYRQACWLITDALPPAVPAITTRRQHQFKLIYGILFHGRAIPPRAARRRVAALGAARVWGVRSEQRPREQLADRAAAGNPLQQLSERMVKPSQ
jgi:hypothetical protein